MGLGCSKKQQEDAGEALVVRLSPFRPRRCLSRRSPSAGGGAARSTAAAGSPASLLALAVDSLARSLHQQPAAALSSLPADLSQLLLERLAATGALDDVAIAKLAGLGLHFHRLPLGGYPELVRPGWLRCLSSPSLEAAELGKTGVSVASAQGQPAAPCAPAVQCNASESSAWLLMLQAQGSIRGSLSARIAKPAHKPGSHCLCNPPAAPQVTDEALAALRAPPRLSKLHLDYCVELTDAGLAALQGAAAAKLPVPLVVLMVLAVA
jgi:hypothetical protein